MRVSATAIEGVCIVDTEPSIDERGAFTRLTCERTLRQHGLVGHFAQTSLSTSTGKHTLRGLHYQAAPYAEVKLVRCLHGRIFDVVVDLRPRSRTFKRSVATELSADNWRAVYVPAECAHGLITLEDHCEVLYHISVEHEPTAARGVRWNDPAFAIAWPVEPLIMSPRDAGYPDFSG
jgi:dTDP-4-dehydrorhamnose 3,5-epimerase